MTKKKAPQNYIKCHACYYFLLAQPKCRPSADLHNPEVPDTAAEPAKSRTLTFGCNCSSCSLLGSFHKTQTLCP